MGIACATIALAGIIVLATDSASNPGDAGVAFGFTGFAILFLNPLSWAPIRLRHAYRFVGGWALGSMFAAAFAWDKAEFAYYHLVVAVVVFAALLPVVAYCSRRRFALAAAFETN